MSNNEQIVEKSNKKKMSPKKLWTIIGCSLLAVAVIATTYWAVIKYVLIDYENMAYLTFKYSVSDTDVNHIPEVTITGVNTNKRYPKNFRVPNKLLGYNVTAIDDYAFAGLDRLETLVLPDTITSIGTGAFSSCENLRSVKLESKNLTSVGEDIFLDSDKWEGNSIEGIVMFGSLLYKYNADMEEGTVVKPIENKVDGEDESKHVYISNDVSLIASGAFANQPNLVSFELPDRFTSVSNSLLQGCTGLRTFIAHNITSVGTRAFSNCTSLEEFDFSNVTAIGEEAFQGTAIRNVELNEEISILENGLFKNCTNLQNVKFNSNLTRIGNETFMNCSNLARIDEGVINNVDFTNNFDDLEFIGSRAFENTGLTRFVIPKNVTSINESTFKDCSSLSEVVLPEVTPLEGEEALDPYGKYAYTGLQTIEANAFKNTTSLTSFVIPSYHGEFIERTIMGEDVTYQNITVNTLYSLGDNVFEGSALESIVLPASLMSIPRNCFKDCVSLNSVTFQDPNNTVLVGIYNGSVVVNESYMSDIKSSAFENTASLDTIVLPNSITAIQSSAFKNSAISSVVLPTNSAFTTIADYTFSNCTNLTSITLSSNIDTIKRNAFEYSGLTSITIPVTVRKMETSVFFGCDDLAVINLDFTESQYNSFIELGSRGWSSNWNIINGNNDRFENVVFLQND